MSESHVYAAVFKPDPECGFLVTVPDVPGCVTSGKTMEEAMNMLDDALCGCLCAYEDEGVELPKPRLPKDIPLEDDGSFTAVIFVDLQRYRISIDNRAVRTNVSIPAWLKYKAERAGLNFSQVLQDGIKRQLGQR